MTESAIQSAIILWLKRQGHLPIKNIAVSLSGTPDVTIITKKGTMYAEIKKPGGRLSPIQKVTISKFRALDAKVFITDNVNEFKEEFSTYYEEVE